MRTALSIAGSDSSGGAGVQADLKTMTMNGVFAMSAITALTAQNTTGVTGILEADPEFLKKQIDAVFEDIRPDAVKIGMVSSSGLIKTIAERLQHYKAGPKAPLSPEITGIFPDTKLEIAAVIASHCTMMFGTNTRTNPIKISTLKVDAHFLTTLVPKSAITKINAAMINVHTQYGIPNSI